MSDLALDVVSNIVANIAFWIILGFAFWLIGRAGRRRFVSFFGFGSQTTIRTYVSNQWNPAASKRPQGFAIALHESMAAQTVAGLVGSSQLRAPEIVRGLIDGIWLNAAFTSTTEVTPVTGDASPHVGGPAVVVGAGVRNSLRRRYVEAGLPHAFLGYELADDPVAARKEGKRKIEIRHRSGDRHVVNAEMQLLIVEKARDAERGTTLFFCLGARGDTTWLATEYLCRNWKKLEREFGESDFVVCLGLPDKYEYRTQYEEPIRLAAMSL